MLTETHLKIAEAIANVLRLNREQRNYLKKGSIVPDDWRDFPHHRGKEPTIQLNIDRARRLFLQKYIDCFSSLGVAFHYIADMWTTLSGSDPRHARWERLIENARFLNDPEIMGIIDTQNFPEEDERQYFGLLETLKNPPQGRRVTLSLATTDHPRWGAPSLDLNFAYRICLSVACSVFSSTTPPEDLEKTLRLMSPWESWKELSARTPPKGLKEEFDKAVSDLKNKDEDLDRKNEDLEREANKLFSKIKRFSLRFKFYTILMLLLSIFFLYSEIEIILSLGLLSLVSLSVYAIFTLNILGTFIPVIRMYKINEPRIECIERCSVIRVQAFILSFFFLLYSFIWWYVSAPFLFALASSIFRYGLSVLWLVFSHPSFRRFLASPLVLLLISLVHFYTARKLSSFLSLFRQIKQSIKQIKRSISQKKQQFNSEAKEYFLSLGGREEADWYDWGELKSLLEEKFKPKEAKKGCFIATAAYGTAFARDINVLRVFRDRVLMRNTFGRFWVRVYYVTSPPIAYVISKSSFLKMLVRRLIIKPLVNTLRDNS